MIAVIIETRTSDADVIRLKRIQRESVPKICGHKRDDNQRREIRLREAGVENSDFIF